jgi:hypothetical protein
VTWTPQEIGTVDAHLWIGSDAGDASVLLRGDWQVCYGLAEAWDHGWLELSHDLGMGIHDLTNSSDHDVCMTHWSPFFSEYSQDALLGDPALDGDGAHLVIPANTTTRFQYGGKAAEGGDWFCIEQTQLTTATNDFWFFGARAPEPLRGIAADGDQDRLWYEIGTNAVGLVGRTRNVFELEIGEIADVAVQAMDLGRVETVADIVEHVPGWLRVVDPGTAILVNEADGSATLVWEAVRLPAAISDGGGNGPTFYDRQILPYRVALEDCPADRNVADVPSAVWADAYGYVRRSEGSPLVVHCAP